MNGRLPPPGLGRILRSRVGCPAKRQNHAYGQEENMSDELSVQIPNSAEQKRLDEARQREVPWKQWGPYLSERQWGTVR